MALESYGAKNENQPALDGDLFEKFQQADTLILEYLKPETKFLSEQKEKFLQGEIDCPHFVYDQVHDEEKRQFAVKEQKLLDLKRELKAKVVRRGGDPDAYLDSEESILAQTYIWAINERIANVRMMKEMQLAKTDPEKYERHMERFGRYSEFIYGSPDPKIFAGTIYSLSQKLPAVSMTEEETLARNRLEDLVKRVQEKNAGNLNFDLPKIETNEDDPLLEGAQEVKELMEAALQDAGLDDWEIEVRKAGNKRSGMLASHRNKKITIPNNEGMSLRSEARKMTLNMIMGLIAHEINTHAVRNRNGADSRLKLLSVGLDRVEKGEEGLATYREQQEIGTEDFAGLTSYLAAGLAKGLDGGGKRNFAEVFSIIEDYISVCGEASADKVKEQAWTACMKVFRGTTGDVPGVVFLKDTVYRKGNMETWEVMSSELGGKIDFDIGKFDVSNKRHLMIMVKLGILDEDLVELEK